MSKKKQRGTGTLQILESGNALFTLTVSKRKIKEISRFRVRLYSVQTAFKTLSVHHTCFSMELNSMCSTELLTHDSRRFLKPSRLCKSLINNVSQQELRAYITDKSIRFHNHSNLLVSLILP